MVASGRGPLWCQPIAEQDLLPGNGVVMRSNGSVLRAAVALLSTLLGSIMEKIRRDGHYGISLSTEFRVCPVLVDETG